MDLDRLDINSEKEELKNLGVTAQQIEAITSDARCLRVIAGAGTGKTTVLTRRIAHLIGNGVYPYNILAITFTNKVAKEMRERTQSLLPDYDISELKICTFHSLCCWILRREAGHLGISKDFVIFDDSDQKDALLKVMPQGTIRKSPEFKKALEFISYYKTRGILPFAVPVEDIITDEDEQCLEFYTKYEKIKSDNSALDFDDLIIYAIAILERPEVGDRYRRRFRNILVDEFQDTNDVQYRLFKLLVGNTEYHNNFFVVGDPDQTIYTWRGASYKILDQEIDHDFTKSLDGEGVTTLTINENFRSTEPILTAANNLISHNESKHPKKLVPYKHYGYEPKVEVIGVRTGKDEAKRIVKEILDLNVNRNDIAILYRSAYLSLQIETALMEAGIQYNVYGGLKFFERKEIKDCSAYFCCLVNDKDDIHFLRVINTPRRGIGEKSIITLYNEASKNGVSVMQYIREIDQHETGLKTKAITILKDLVSKLDQTEHRIAEKTDEISKVLDDFIDLIGYKEYLLETEEKADEKIENIEEYLENIRHYFKDNPGYSLTDYLQNVALTTAQDEMNDQEKVNLMTVHTAKGLEFKYVFVAGLNEDVFPHVRAVNETKRGGLQEERRLCFVAFTRARQKLYITYNHDYNFVTGEDKQPSSFIKEAGLSTTYSYSSNYYNGTGNMNNTSNSPRPLYGPYGKMTQTFGPKVNTGVLKSTTTSTNTSWSVGDICVHRKFGEGVVKKVDGNDVTIEFPEHGTKVLQGNHPALSKKE